MGAGEWSIVIMPMLTCGILERTSKLRSPLKPEGGVVEVLVYVPVEHEAELRTPLPEGRRRRLSWGGRCLSGRGIIGRLRLNGGRASQEKPKDQSRAIRSAHDTPLPCSSVSLSLIHI